MQNTIIIGQPGGWSVEVDLNGTRGRLVSKRGSPRIFGRFETLAGYLKRVGIEHFSVDTEHYEPAPARKRPDAASRMARTHEAAEHDAWFRQRVEEATGEADQPDAEWVDSATVMERVRQRIRSNHGQRGKNAR
ncbi:hypothetical protein [Modicisalibacter radicis]|uniref:hypothetical protein n=1 Tax=Halomonas sp. EAR18 TaxID=2518972 RepID=UPI00109D314C|nr:hypothetical protein [Halomonas sp. EAR18]